MARTPTTADAFNAIAEGARRQILETLVGQELAVNSIVELVGLTQPQVSKHLAVLRSVDLVRVRENGRQRLYSLDGDALRVVSDWLRPFEQLWSDRFSRLDDVLADSTRPDGSTGTQGAQS